MKLGAALAHFLIERSDRQTRSGSVNALLKALHEHREHEVSGHTVMKHDGGKRLCIFIEEPRSSAHE